MDMSFLHFIIPCTCTHAVSYFVLNVLLVGQWHKVGSGIVPLTFGLKGALGIRANVIGNDCFCPACCWAFVFCRVPSRKALLPGTIQRNVVYVLFNKKRMRRLVLLFAPSHRQVGWLMGVSCFVLWKLLSLASLASKRLALLMFG